MENILLVIHLLLAIALAGVLGAAISVPVAALIYFDDMYVDAELSLATAEAIPRLRYWITNEYEHDGLRQDPGVFRRLKAMLDD